MMMSRGFYSLLFVVLIIAIIFLVFHIVDISNRCQQSKVQEQDKITKIARLIVQSATQDHPLFKYEHSLEAKILLNDIITKNGGLVMAEKNLKLPQGKMEMLREQIKEQHEDVQSYIMDKIIERHPKYDTHINELAGLKRRKKSRRRRVAKHRNDRHRDS